ncbi:MAG: uncharacterized protein QOH39_1266 [Verrucomicrobiota bacterium]|jgi:uncharacterized protein YggE
MKLICLALLTFPICVFADGGLPNQPYMYVEGRTEFEKLADMVTIRFNVIARNADQAKANQQVQAQTTKVLTLCDERKIPKNDVVAQDITSDPDYEEVEKGKANRQTIIGYTVTRRVEITIRNLSIFPKLVDDLFNLGGIEVSNVASDLSTKSQMDDEAWQKALTNAREQAEKTVKAVGMKIDSIYAISPRAFPEIISEIMPGERVTVLGMNVPTPDDLVDPYHYRLLPVKMYQSVHVIYLISPAK